MLLYILLHCSQTGGDNAIVLFQVKFYAQKDV